MTLVEATKEAIRRNEEAGELVALPPLLEDYPGATLDEISEASGLFRAASRRLSAK